MTTAEYNFSSAGLIKSVERSSEHPYAVKEVETVDVGKPILVLFGGEYTYMPQSANHYIKQMKAIFEPYDVGDINIYSVYYEFGSRHADIERTELFKAAGRKLTEKLHPNAEKFRQEKLDLMKQNEPTPEYIAQLYRAIILPLIIKSDGTLLDKQTVAKNFSKLRMYGYSHGAAAIYMLGQYTKKELQKHGFNSAEATQLTRHIIAIQFGPVAPLEHPDFKTLSFMSGTDTHINGFNKFSKYMYNNAENLHPSYFHLLGADMFVVKKISERFDSEHNDEGIMSEKNLTEDGKLLFNALRYAIYHSMCTNNTDMASLVTGPGVDFNQMKQNGILFYDRMLKSLRIRKQILEHDYQI